MSLQTRVHRRALYYLTAFAVLPVWEWLSPCGVGVTVSLALAAALSLAVYLGMLSGADAAREHYETLIPKEVVDLLRKVHSPEGSHAHSQSP